MKHDDPEMYWMGPLMRGKSCRVEFYDAVKEIQRLRAVVADIRRILEPAADCGVAHVIDTAYDVLMAAEAAAKGGSFSQHHENDPAEGGRR